MLGAETKPSGVPVTAATLQPEADCFWKQIIEPVDPFLKSVANQLAEQVEAFDSEIAAKSHYRSLCSQV